MTKSHDPQSGRIKKLVSRLLHHSSNLHDTSPDDSDADSGIATPKWLGSYRATPSASSSFSAPKAYGRDTSISLDLWNSAYNSLRDSLSSAGLVTVYESILCQELPNNQSIGGINQSLPRSDDERLRNLITITESGLKKCRTKSQADDQAKALIRASRKIIKSVWADYPSTAVAWSGICILTPQLLLGATIAIEDMRRGAIHVLGRIPWYMHLSELILASAWKSDADFYIQRDRTREKLLKLYRKVLEFEMNCVCAAASSWNNAAKNVVGWHKLGAMVREIEELDTEISNLITNYIDRGVADSIRRYNEDLKLDAKDEGPCPFGDGSSSTAPSSAPSSAPFQLDSSHAADAMTEVKHSTVRV
ncbi:hypothetical protein TrVFT333_010787 [Trichoderma virens FT-333]|nr:hypothetical protein TrVFT333_010787 [Trichoderma virens FT-333]